MKSKDIKVVGVTFCNDKEDGGESRQYILKTLRENNRRIVDLELCYTKFNNEDAIKVRERSTKKIIGWIPRTEVADVIQCKIKHTIGFINCYKNTEYVCITKPNYPTNVEYHRMRKMCEKAGVAMPAYDKRAYDAYEKEVLRVI